MSRHRKLMDRAIDLALTADYRWRHGAILARGNKIITSSTNKIRNDVLIAPQDVSFHAEELAIRKYCRVVGVSYVAPMDLSDYTIYVARVNKAGAPQISRPCETCLSSLEYFGVWDIYYTNEVGGFSHEQLRY